MCKCTTNSEDIPSPAFCWENFVSDIMGRASLVKITVKVNKQIYFHSRQPYKIHQHNQILKISYTQSQQISHETFLTKNNHSFVRAFDSSLP